MPRNSSSKAQSESQLKLTQAGEKQPILMGLSFQPEIDFTAFASVLTLLFKSAIACVASPLQMFTGREF